MSMACAVFLDGPERGNQRWLPSNPPPLQAVTMRFSEGISPTISGIVERFMYLRQSDQPRADGKWEYKLKAKP